MGLLIQDPNQGGAVDAFDPAEPGPIGGTTPGAGSFSTLESADSVPIGNITDLWDDSGTTFEGIKLDVDDNASATDSRLLHLLKNGATVIAVRKDGQLTTTGNILVGNGVLLKNAIDQTFFYFDWGNTILCYQHFQPDSSGARDLGQTGRRWRKMWIDSTVTAGGTTGAQTINKAAGSVNFEAAAASLVVTNSLVSADSIILCTVRTNDATMKSVVAVGGSGSFTLYPNAAPTAEVRVDFHVMN